MLDLFFAGEAGFRQEGVVVAASHGPKPGSTQFKLSFRLIVPGFKMRMSAIKARLEAVDTAGVFDRAPYNKAQKLRCIGAYKTPTDRRVMALQGAAPSAALLLGTLAQLTASEDVELRCQPRAGVQKRPRRALGDITPGEVLHSAA